MRMNFIKYLFKAPEGFGNKFSTLNMFNILLLYQNNKVKKSNKRCSQQDSLEIVHACLPAVIFKSLLLACETDMKHLKFIKVFISFYNI